MAAFQLVFGSLFAPQPRLGIVDEGGSQVAAEMAAEMAAERAGGAIVPLMDDSS